MKRFLWIVPAGIIALFVLVAVLANFIAPFPPNEPSLAERLRPPFWVSGGSLAHLLGTDTLGRDVLSRMIYGARMSLLVVAVALSAGAALGVTLGMLSGYVGGRLDDIIMRAADVTMTFPAIFVALLLAITMGPGFQTVIIAVGFVLWARFARLVRGEVLTVKERDYIAQAKVAGAPVYAIMLRHLLPNIMNTVMVLVSLEVGTVIIMEASLSFVGAGIPPPNATWGSIVSDGRSYISTAWWISTFPGAAIAAVVLAFNLFGDWIRYTFDPKLRQL